MWLPHQGAAFAKLHCEIQHVQSSMLEALNSNDCRVPYTQMTAKCLWLQPLHVMIGKIHRREWFEGSQMANIHQRSLLLLPLLLLFLLPLLSHSGESYPPISINLNSSLAAVTAVLATLTISQCYWKVKVKGLACGIQHVKETLRAFSSCSLCFSMAFSFSLS